MQDHELRLSQLKMVKKEIVKNQKVQTFYIGCKTYV